jgi:long-chain alkane monooxygenase
VFHLGWFLGNGFSVQGWPAASPDYDWTKAQLYQDAAQLLERGGFDMLVIEDTSMVPDTYKGSSEVYLAHAHHAPKHDPSPLVPLIAAATKHIGIVPTFVTTYYPPFLLARLVATLDHLTDGRVGWNIVTGTSSLSAQNYGLEALPPHDTRYDMADEFVDLCCLLWDSWEPDAVLADQKSGVYADHTKVHRVDFEGQWYKCRGPLNVIPSPQLRPVLVQAGGSPRGREFAARHAEVVVALGGSLEAMKAYRDDVHSHMTRYGRKSCDIKVMFNCNPIVAETSEEAWEMRRRGTTVTDSKIHNSLAGLSLLTGIDFGRYDLDEQLPTDVHSVGNQSVLQRFYVQDPLPTIREMASQMISQTSLPLVGTPEEVADKMQEAMDYVGGDGFFITGSFRLGYIENLVEHLVPVMRRRGIIRQGYEHETFRQNLLAF